MSTPCAHHTENDSKTLKWLIEAHRRNGQEAESEEQRVLLERLKAALQTP